MAEIVRLQSRDSVLGVLSPGQNGEAGSNDNIFDDGDLG